MTYADGQFDDARYAMALAESFVGAGGDALNYARVSELEKNSAGKLHRCSRHRSTGTRLLQHPRASLY